MTLTWTPVPPLLLLTADSHSQVFTSHLSRRMSQSSSFSGCQKHSWAADLWPQAVVSRSQPCHYPSITAALCCVLTSITLCHLIHIHVAFCLFSQYSQLFSEVGVYKVAWFAYSVLPTGVSPWALQTWLTTHIHTKKPINVWQAEEEGITNGTNKKSNSCLHDMTTTRLFDISNQSPVFNINATARMLTGTRVLASLHGLTVDFRPYSLFSRLTMVRPHPTDVIQCHSAPCILMWTPHTIRTASMLLGIDSTLTSLVETSFAHKRFPYVVLWWWRWRWKLVLTIHIIIILIKSTRHPSCAVDGDFSMQEETTHIRIAMIHQRIRVVSKNKPFISLQWTSSFRGQWAQIPAAQSPQQHERATARTTSWCQKLIAP